MRMKAMVFGRLNDQVALILYSLLTLTVQQAFLTYLMSATNRFHKVTRAEIT